GVRGVDLGRDGTTVVALGGCRNPHREGRPPGGVAQAGGGPLRPVLRGRVDHLSGVTRRPPFVTAGSAAPRGVGRSPDSPPPRPRCHRRARGSPSAGPPRAPPPPQPPPVQPARPVPGGSRPRANGQGQ